VTIAATEAPSSHGHRTFDVTLRESMSSAPNPKSSDAIDDSIRIMCQALLLDTGDHASCHVDRCRWAPISVPGRPPLLRVIEEIKPSREAPPG
jgi:hypothetical protein